MHELKTDPPAFHALADGRKRFEIHWNDRRFRTGDTLHLRETLYSRDEMKVLGYPLKYTGQEVFAVVTFVAYGPIHGLREGWVVMSIEPLQSMPTLAAASGSRAHRTGCD